MHASRQRVVTTLMVTVAMVLLVTITGTTTIIEETIKGIVEAKASLPVEEVNLQTRVGNMSREMTQCGHTAGTSTLPVAAQLKTAQRSIPAARE